jgi:hypothetical protein
MVDTMQKLTRLSSQIGTTCIGLQERQDTSLVLPASVEPLNTTLKKLSSIHIVEGKFYPLIRSGVPNRNIFRIPVVDIKEKPLMPCTAKRARALLTSGKAVAKRNKIGIFYIQIKIEKKPKNQLIVLGIDPGSKYEGYSIVGTKETIINIMCDATTWVSDAIKSRRMLRINRRYRKVRYRKQRNDNKPIKKCLIAPSIKARWDTKLRIIYKIIKIIPIQKIVVEDIIAKTRKTYKTQSQWNKNFTPLQIGKNYFYHIVNSILNLKLISGIETKILRGEYKLKKCKNKHTPIFETHCIDSWVIAAHYSGAKTPTTRSLYYLSPLRWHRRQLHKMQPSKNGKRILYGGTLSLGIKRGTLINHNRYGFCYIGGIALGRVSLHRLSDGKRLAHNLKVKDLKLLTKLSFRSRYIS